MHNPCQIQYIPCEIATNLSAFGEKNFENKAIYDVLVHSPPINWFDLGIPIQGELKRAWGAA